MSDTVAQIWKQTTPPMVDRAYLALFPDGTFRPVLWVEERTGAGFHWRTRGGNLLRPDFVVRYTELPDVDADEMKCAMRVFLRQRGRRLN